MFVDSENGLGSIEGLKKIPKRLLTALKLNCICVFLRTLGNNESQTQEVLFERGSN